MLLLQDLSVNSIRFTALITEKNVFWSILCGDLDSDSTTIVLFENRFNICYDTAKSITKRIANAKKRS